MTNETATLVLEHLRRIRQSLGDIREVAQRVSAVKLQPAKRMDISTVSASVSLASTLLELTEA